MRGEGMEKCRACSLHGWRGCEMHERLECLAANLRIAGALCAAYWEGWEQHEHHQLYSAHGYRTDSQWMPGCGRSCP
jgi:hypothetical protein